MQHLAEVRTVDQQRALWLSTIAFTVCFAVWTIFSIIGIQIKKDLGLNDTQFGLLVGTPILTGSLIRLMLGIWTDQYGGRVVYTVVMLAAAVATWLLTFALRLSDVPAGRARRRHCRRLVRGRHRLCLALVSDGASRAPRSASSAPAMSARPSPNSSRRSSWWPTAGRPSRRSGRSAIAVMGVVFWLITKDDPAARSAPRSGREAASAWLRSWSR